MDAIGRSTASDAGFRPSGPSPWRFIRGLVLLVTIGLAILLVVLGFNLLGDAIGDRLDPRRNRAVA